uniref:Uncharacterized protein n=1 Tax=Rhizophora mucronata TaxID=61149 RepID=A0A2P2QKS4_RHIMU
MREIFGKYIQTGTTESKGGLFLFSL